MTADQAVETAFEVDRSDLARTRVQQRRLPPINDGQCLLTVDRFAFTANNITYATLGDSFGYWAFFPAPDNWGRIPVWGHATVTASAHEQVSVGTRIYGLLPMANRLVVQPERVRDDGFIDAATHRRDLPRAYNAYRMTPAEEDESSQDRRALLSPLFLLSFLLDDHLAEQDLLGNRVVISSASSKAAVGTAFLLHRRGASVVGLTSTRNRDFVDRLGIYEQVITYGRLDDLDPTPTVFLDLAGDTTLRQAVHRALSRALAHSLAVGLTHWDRSPWQQPEEASGDDTPALFSAPARIVARTREWGRAGFESRFGADFAQFAAWSAAWLRLTRSFGADDVEAAYQRALRGTVLPADGVILSMRPAPIEDRDKPTS